MNALTLPSTPSADFTSSSAMSALALEVAKCLKLVAPVSMDAAAQLAWIASAVDALEDIRADEVRAVSAEVRRSITRHNQIIPEIARLVAEKRKRSHRPTPETQASNAEWGINREAARRRASARGREELDAVWEWERQARIDAGLHVDPRPLPLSRAELDAMTAQVRSLGLNSGFLTYRDGQLVEA